MSDAVNQSASPAAPAPAPKSMDDIMSLCKRRGFIYQASEIYGGINGFWDYGPLGAQLKKNLRDAWWQDMIMSPCWGRKGPGGEKVRNVPVETCIIQNPKVWEASGHIGGFNDPMVDDKETKGRFRADHLFGLFLIPPMPDEELVRFAAEFIVQRKADGTPRIVPSAAWVASGLQEAVETLIADPKSIKVNTKMTRPIAKAQRKSVASHTAQIDAWVIVELKTGEVFSAIVSQLPPSFLSEFAPLVPSPLTGNPGTLTPPRQFNLMFKTYVGATATDDDIAYLRPETAQGVFIQFKNVVDTTRVRMPFGIGNTGKSFRNEVTPRNFTFRSREFEQMELEFFCHPDESMQWFEFWREFRMKWWESLGLAGDNLRLYDTPKKDLAHYAMAGSDVEYRFPFTYPGFGELEGVAHRGDFDLKQHEKHSKVKMQYFDTDRGETLPNGSKKGEWYTPHCIEPAAGLDRGVLAVLCEAYTKDASRPSPEIMKFHPRLAPIKAAVFPLVNKDGMPEVAEKLYDELSARFGRTGFIETDPKQSIGKRYARMDEAGCPFCFTIDGETLTNQTVTVRDRDTGGQERIGIDKVSGYLGEKLGV
ncbi:MAG: glycine--tRNA ligase [Phycisphaerales bacterium]